MMSIPILVVQVVLDLLFFGVWQRDRGGDEDVRRPFLALWLVMG